MVGHVMHQGKGAIGVLLMLGSEGSIWSALACILEMIMSREGQRERGKETPAETSIMML